LRNVIRVIYKNSDYNDKNITNLFQTVGKEIINNVCINLFNVYYKHNNKININSNK
jgi:hypothetical protein